MTEFIGHLVRSQCCPPDPDAALEAGQSLGPRSNMIGICVPARILALKDGVPDIARELRNTV